MHIYVSDNRLITPGRICGTCNACCIYLGIEELKKPTGAHCRHLSLKNGPEKQCSIYDKRPAACSGYQCLWLTGLGKDSLHPSESGILLTPYEDERNPGKIAITAQIFASRKAMPLIPDLIGEMMTLPFVTELRLVWLAEKKAILCRDGNLYPCKVLPQKPGDYESLNFLADLEHPLGQYYIKEFDR